MRVLSLFAGVGCFDYAWTQLGWETVAFAEMDKWCQRVLEKHHPGVPIYDDVRDVTYERLQKDGIVSDTPRKRVNRKHENNSVQTKQNGVCTDKLNGTRPVWDCSGAGNQPARIDLICGGFPCQDLSVAGKQKGMGEGTRSGLWGEFARIIGEFKPRWVVVENVAALLSGDDGRWMGRVLGDLAEIGYDAEWHVIPAGNPNGLSAGAPHRRERVWIVAYPKVMRVQGHGASWQQEPHAHEEERLLVREGERPRATERDAKPGMGLLAHGIAAGLSRSGWLPEPGIGRVATGVPDRVNKLKALGNGLVWEIPYAIGLAIIESES